MEKPNILVVGANEGAPHHRNKSIREMRELAVRGAVLYTMPERYGNNLPPAGTHINHLIVSKSFLTPNNITIANDDLRKAYEILRESGGGLPESVIFLGIPGAIDDTEDGENFYQPFCKDAGVPEGTEIVLASGDTECATLMHTVFPESSEPVTELDPFGYFHEQDTSRLKADFIVQTGCDMCCTYCCNNYLKKESSKSISVPLERAVAELKELRETHPEITALRLFGQSLGLYKDNGERCLHKLVEEVDKLGFEQVSLFSVAPQTLYPELVKAIRDSNTITGMHSTIETGSERQAAEIGRPGTLDKLEDALKQIRKRKSQFVWSTSLIAGLPGTTDADDEATSKYVMKNHGLVYGITPFSNSPCLPASDLPNQLSYEEILEHEKKLQILQFECAMVAGFTIEAINRKFGRKGLRVQETETDEQYGILHWLQHPLNIGIPLVYTDGILHNVGEKVHVAPTQVLWADGDRQSNISRCAIRMQRGAITEGYSHKLEYDEGYTSGNYVEDYDSTPIGEIVKQVCDKK
ncbi:radical SAM protein [Candidatus Saccharibacteria bacterium]|nr:radical SAM protein [Candidatus Saccharibacteria bacterium]MCL1962823.1 radical SAM protein [Candidatus Saccharibacteria bacterium]